MSLFQSIEKRAYLLLTVLFLCSYAFFFQGGGGNQNVRVLLTRAIIDHASFSIDAYREDVVHEGQEKPFVLTEDWARFDGHYYANKSPGLSLLAVPSFAAAGAVLSWISYGDEAQRVLWSTYASTVCTVGLLSTLLCLLLFRSFISTFALPVATAFWLTCCFGFGTLAFSYSSVFQSHQAAACCGFLSFVLAIELRRGAQREALRAFCAGLSASLAVLIEPSAVCILALVAIYLISFGAGRRHFALFALGCIPMGAIQLAYNQACFGRPLASSYDYSNEAVMFKVAGSMFVWPTLQRFYWVLAAPERGLLVSSPVLIFCIPGARELLKASTRRAEALLCIAVGVAFIVFVASFAGWHGGSAAGPRYLLPSFPFLFVLAAAAFARYSKWFVPIAGLSVLINLAIATVGNEVSLGIGFPVGFVVGNLLNGNVSINPLPVPWVGWTKQYPSAEAAFAAWYAASPNFNSFNLGEILFPESPASLIPLLLFWWLILWLARRWSITTPPESARPAAAGATRRSRSVHRER